MVLLSFDIEEFDMPAEYGVDIPLEEQLDITTQGLQNLLPLLNNHGVKATFFTTGTYALHRGELIKLISDQGHEIASHGLYHSKFEPADLLHSKEILESVTGKRVVGYRSPRMFGMDDVLLKEAGFLYNSSLNPTYLPGRYNNLRKPRGLYNQGGIIQLPASVSPMRIPLFWLSLHNFPLKLYTHLSWRAIKKDGYLNTYFHPWEFNDNLSNPKYNMPYIARHNSGAKMVERFDKLLSFFDKRNSHYSTISSFLFK